METKKNVLIFPSATYPAMQIIDCLKNNMRFHVIAAASYPNHSEYVCEDCIIDIPFVNNVKFIEEFRKILVLNHIDYVIPTDETIAVLLKKYEEELPAVVVCSPYKTTILCRHKLQMYEALKDKFYIPKIYNSKDVDCITDYPIFVKPDEGQGSRGSRIINCCEDLESIGDLGGMVVSEYLPGEEYTVDCFTTKDRKLIFCNPRVRTRIMNGITARGNNIPCSEEFLSIINDLNETINFRGYWYVQLRRDRDGNLKLLEICTRFAGSFAISKGKGVNLPLLALCDFSDLDTNVIENDYTVECDKTYIDRYRLDTVYEHVYVDYDDTVTCRNGTSVNPYVIAYLYQCRAKGIKITLITRHSSTFDESLKESFQKLKISPDLFDNIYEIDWSQPKYQYISDPQRSIFLDNSFAERKKVHDELGMNVFDVCNVDCLFDWRF